LKTLELVFILKYGDGGVDLSPIADLLKSQVFNLGKFLKVDDTIINAKPSDGLYADSRSDEDQIGATYDELEWAMKPRESNSKISNRQKEVLKIYRSFNTKNKHKMEPIPICIIPTDLLTD